MLRKIRVTLAIVFFAAITLLFLDFTGTIHAWLGWMAKIQFLPAIFALHVWLGWMAKIQFLPAIFALNTVVIIALIAITLIFGRIYCSVICPLGVFQDIVSWISSKRKKKKARFSYSPAKSWLRYSILAIFIIAFIAGIHSLVALLAPYSSYGRIVSNLFAPIWQWGNNVLASVAEHYDSYAFYRTDVWLKSLSTFIIAALTFCIVIVLAWKNGRTYCNTVCPVGTVLGFLSKYALLKPVIDTDKCKGCSLCSRKCKASCIDYKNHTIDYSRCVDCMDCIDNCEFDAIHYGLRKKNNHVIENDDTKGKKKNPASRRTFITLSALMAAETVLKAQEKKVDGGLAIIEDKKIPNRATAIVPPGAISHSNFATHCTACQLCVSVCPNGVLRPSTDITRLMQPEMSYERGYCRPECTKCSEVCPTGAINLIDIAEKSAIHIGHAVWVKENCVPLTDGVECGNCARHCPTGAIQMVNSDPNDSESPKIPVINTERCIGCGACENLCPARPFSAIYVEGHEVHRTV